MVPKDPKACHRFAHVSCLHCLFAALDQDFCQHLSAGHPLTWYDNLPQFQVLKRWSFDEVWSIMVHISPYHGPLVHHPIRVGFSAGLFFSVASLGLPRVGGDAKSQVGPAMVNGGCGQGLEIYGKYGLNIWTMYIHVLCQQADSCLCSVVFVQPMFSRFCPAPSGIVLIFIPSIPCLGSVALRACAANIAECPDRANSWDLGSCSRTNTCRASMSTRRFIGWCWKKNNFLWWCYRKDYFLVSVGVCFVLFCPLDPTQNWVMSYPYGRWWQMFGGWNGTKMWATSPCYEPNKTSSKPCSLGVPLRSDVSRWPTLDTLKNYQIYSSSDPQQLTVMTKVPCSGQPQTD